MTHKVAAIPASAGMTVVHNRLTLGPSPTPFPSISSVIAQTHALALSSNRPGFVDAAVDEAAEFILKG
jgi:hypothetical protein